MKRKYKKLFRKLKRNKKHFRMFIFLIALFLFTITGVLAKYIISRSGSASSTVDQVYYDIVEDSSTALENKKSIYYFHVNNYLDDTHINQVLMKYYLKVNNLTSTPTTITDKLYYKNSSNNWVEIPKLTTGDYMGYYEGMANLVFSGQTTHNYKLELTAAEDILTSVEYDFTLDIKLTQTKS